MDKWLCCRLGGIIKTRHDDGFLRVIVATMYKGTQKSTETPYTVEIFPVATITATPAPVKAVMVAKKRYTQIFLSLHVV